MNLLCYVIVRVRNEVGATHKLLMPFHTTRFSEMAFSRPSDGTDMLPRQSVFQSTPTNAALL